ncbi:cell division protein FtsQ/DivIB [Arthrobacter sp. N199823]|uniref:cell division protein FtsQ/DivIB n=1 Tax=Arthrobacter sp. N199823 TaxID=2058895 RepID=UPI000CE475D2|nr:cell division protein FtsQ/DivIB [Arthrobacter sp. N199823]
MAEPRKPRVIRTRKPATGALPVVPAVGSAAEVPATQAPGSAAAFGTVRGTSEKVAMLPVPLDDAKPTPRVPRPAAMTRPTSTGKKTAPGPAQAAQTKSAQTKPAQPKSAPTTHVPGKLAPKSSLPVKAVPRTVAPGKRIVEEESTATAKAKAESSLRGSAGRGSSVEGEPGAPGDGSAVAKVLAFPLPSYKRRRRTILISVAAIVAVLILVMGIALYSPALSVQTIEFEGNKLVSEDTLQEALAPVMSRPLPQVTGADVSSLLRPVVQVKSSRIEARPPSTLVVHVVERVPVALLKNGSAYSLVDQDGVELGTTKEPAKAGLPLIDGGKAAIGKDTFQAMTGVLATLPKSILSQLANASAKSRDTVELKLTDGRSVIWGNASDMELKAQVLEALLNAPLPTVPAGKPAPVPAKVFDVSAPRHPVTR